MFCSNYIMKGVVIMEKLSTKSEVTLGVPDLPPWLGDVMEINRETGRLEFFAIDQRDRTVWFSWQPSPSSDFKPWGQILALPVKHMKYGLHYGGGPQKRLVNVLFVTTTDDLYSLCETRPDAWGWQGQLRSGVKELLSARKIYVAIPFGFYILQLEVINSSGVREFTRERVLNSGVGGPSGWNDWSILRSVEGDKSNVQIEIDPVIISEIQSAKKHLNIFF